MADHEHPIRTPISVLTGFLGSGKTTVLNHLLRHPDLAQTAVVINEFGEIGLDHELVEATTENLVLLQSGCLCCTIRGDLVQTLQDLVDRRLRGEIETFDRLIVETTGLADPVPILHTLMTDSVIARMFRLDGVIVTVDAAVGGATLDTQEEAVKQAAMADRILLTKTDLVEPHAVRKLEARLRNLNPGAQVIRVHNGAVEPSRLLNAGLYNAKTKSLDVQTWLNVEAYDGPGHHHHHDHSHDVNRHDDRISAVAYTVEEPIAPVVFDLWLEALLLLRGPNILRMKAIVNVEGTPAPFVLHGVQHIFHPPTMLRSWPSHDRRSRIVLIGRDLTDEFLTESFGFLGRGDQYLPDNHNHAEQSA